MPLRQLRSGARRPERLCDTAASDDAPPEKSDRCRLGELRGQYWCVGTGPVLLLDAMWSHTDAGPHATLEQLRSLSVSPAWWSGRGRRGSAVCGIDNDAHICCVTSAGTTCEPRAHELESASRRVVWQVDRVCGTSARDAVMLEHWQTQHILLERS